MRTTTKNKKTERINTIEEDDESNKSSVNPFNNAKKPETGSQPYEIDTERLKR